MTVVGDHDCTAWIDPDRFNVDHHQPDHQCTEGDAQRRQTGNSSSATAQARYIEVTDTGTGIAEELLPHIF